MTITTRNEAAERLLHAVSIKLGWGVSDPRYRLLVPEIHEALAAEYGRGHEAAYRATVERFYNEALGLSWDDDHGNRVIAIDALRLIVDEEVAQ